VTPFFEKSFGEKETAQFVEGGSVNFLRNETSLFITLEDKFMSWSQSYTIKFTLEMTLF
jgi:hypothetical protein